MKNPRYKDVATAQGVNSKSAKKLSGNIGKLENKLAKVNTTVMIKFTILSI